MENLEDIFEKKFKLTKIDIGEFSSLKVGPMKFKIECYDIENIGRLSILRGKAMLGLMKMDTLMFTCFNKDVPFFNYDRIHAFGKDTLLIECYDTLKEKKEYPSLLSIKEKLNGVGKYEQKPAWYDSIRLKESLACKGKKVTKLFDEVATSFILEFSDITIGAKDIDPKEKKELQKKYIEGLLSNGGVSTDMFIKNIGKEKTETLYRKYLFGIED